MHFTSFGDFFYFWSSIAFNLGIVVSVVVTFRRGQAIVRRRVARSGRPVSGAFLGVQFLWCFAKSVVWPLNLLVWLVLGRPGPGTYLGGRPAPSSTVAPST